MKNITATGNLYGETKTVKQISKAKAFKLFAEGKTIYFQASNIWPFSMWQSLCPVTFDNERKQSSIELNSSWSDVKIKGERNQFEWYVSEFKHYNCDSERGKYVYFYEVI